MAWRDCTTVRRGTARGAPSESEDSRTSAVRKVSVSRWVVGEDSETRPTEGSRRIGTKVGVPGESGCRRRRLPWRGRVRQWAAGRQGVIGGILAGEARGCVREGV